MLLNRIFKPHGSFQMIKEREWIRFLVFPISTIVCMVTFAGESEQMRNSELIVPFVLVLLNFLVFYIIRDVVYKEGELQQIRLLQERTKNQMNMYQYMESVYGEQRKKVHDFKNSMECIHGLLKSKRYEEAQEYLGQMTENWIEEIDYINTNHPIVDSVINQKFKQAKRKGIPLLLSINNLEKLKMKDEDIVILLGNLLDNAIKYASKNSVIRVMIEKEQISFWNACDEDMGAMADTLCDPFVVGDASRGSRKGSGLGLTIAKNICQLHGFELELVLECSRVLYLFRSNVGVAPVMPGDE